MHRLRLIGVSVLIAAAWLGVAASPAAAHTVSGQGATNFRTRILSVVPAVPGLEVRSVELGSRLEVTWTGSGTLLVIGYEDEPYLKLEDGAVFRNRRSPATYLNQTRFGGVAIPPDADPKAPPDWVRVGSGHTVRWHDHRIHWMGGTLPAQVRAAPGSTHQVFPWKVGLLAGTQPVNVTGTLDWVPGSSPWPWVALVVLIAGLGIAAAVSARWAAGLLLITAVVVAGDVFHAVGTGLAFAGSTGHRIWLVIGGSYYSVLAWVLGIIAIRLLARRSLDGLFAAVFAGLVVGLFGGLADVTSLSRSQVPFDFGLTVARLLVAVSMGGGIGLVAGGILAFRANRPAPVPAGADVWVDDA